MIGIDHPPAIAPIENVSKMLMLGKDQPLVITKNKQLFWKGLFQVCKNSESSKFYFIFLTLLLEEVIIKTTKTDVKKVAQKTCLTFQKASSDA